VIRLVLRGARSVSSADRECYGDTVELRFERFDPEKNKWVAGTQVNIPVDVESSLHRPRHLNAPKPDAKTKSERVT